MTEPEYFVIWSIEHGAWWKPAEFGYTDAVSGAGRYLRIDAERIVRRANVVKVNECMIPVEAIAALGAATVLRLRYQQAGGHVHCRLFTSPTGLTFAKNGDVVFSVEEWQAVRAALARAGVEILPEEATTT